MDTHPTVDKILCTDRILSIYPLIHGQTCHAWMVDTKKCTVEQNYLLIRGHLAISSEGCHGTFNEIGLRWPQFIYKEGRDQREKCEPHIWRRICDKINECEKTFEKVEKLICTVWIIEASHTRTLSTMDTWWCTVECPRMTSFTVLLDLTNLEIYFHCRLL